jgi:hypothetical protein
MSEHDVSEIIAKMAPEDQANAWSDYYAFGTMFAKQNDDGTYRYIDIRDVYIDPSQDQQV